MSKIRGLSIVLSGLLLTSGSAYADIGDFFSSIFTNKSHHHKSSRTHRKTKKSRKHYSPAQMTDEKKIQKVLKQLGFYHGGN